MVLGLSCPSINIVILRRCLNSAVLRRTAPAQTCNAATRIFLEENFRTVRQAQQPGNLRKLTSRKYIDSRKAPSSRNGSKLVVLKRPEKVSQTVWLTSTSGQAVRDLCKPASCLQAESQPSVSALGTAICHRGGSIKFKALGKATGMTFARLKRSALNCRSRVT